MGLWKEGLKVDGEYSEMIFIVVSSMYAMTDLFLWRSLLSLEVIRWFGLDLCGGLVMVQEGWFGRGEGSKSKSR